LENKVITENHSQKAKESNPKETHGNSLGKIKSLSALNKDVLIQTVKEALENSKERKFEQTIEAGVNIKGINFKQQQNRIDVSVQLPNPFKSKPKVLLFAKDNNTINLLKDSVNKIVKDEEIINVQKKDIKKLARDYDLFFAEPTVMALIGKHLGQILAPRGKMPKPVPPNANALKTMIEQASKTVTISNKKGKNLPTLHFPIGKEKMDTSKIIDNFIAIYTKLVDALPGKIQNIKSLYIKTTMGKPIFVYRVE